MIRGKNPIKFNYFSILWLWLFVFSAGAPTAHGESIEIEGLVAELPAVIRG